MQSQADPGPRGRESERLLVAAHTGRASLVVEAEVTDAPGFSNSTPTTRRFSARPLQGRAERMVGAGLIGKKERSRRVVAVCPTFE
jgi:hypothetical protein